MRLAPLVLVIGLFSFLATDRVQASTQLVASKTPPVTRLECGAPRKSLVSDTSLHLVFSNQTKGTVSIYWLDFNGERVLYNTLGPGESDRQQTYVTHPWVIVDAEGRCIEQLVPNEAGTYNIPIRRR